MGRDSNYVYDWRISTILKCMNSHFKLIPAERMSDRASVRLVLKEPRTPCMHILFFDVGCADTHCTRRAATHDSKLLQNAKKSLA